MHELKLPRAHLEFELDHGETVIFDEATYIEQRNMSLLMEIPDITHIVGQYDLDGRLHVTNYEAHAKAQRLAEVRAELMELTGATHLTLIKGGKN